MTSTAKEHPLMVVENDDERIIGRRDYPGDRENPYIIVLSPLTNILIVNWYRSTFYNALILGICNFLAPGIWGAMNALGAGGSQSPSLVNAANALTFCLMVLSCFFAGPIVRLIGIKGALIFGTLGYAPYAAGLYTNNRFGVEWFVLLGAALCGIRYVPMNSLPASLVESQLFQL